MIIYEDEARMKSCLAALLEERERHSGPEILIAFRQERQRNFVGAQVPKSMARAIGEELIRFSQS